MTLKVGERLVLKRFIDEAPAGWSARAIAAAAEIDGAVVEIAQVERSGEDVLARDLATGAGFVRSASELLDTYQRIEK